jgi:predicted dehydrogenase
MPRPDGPLRVAVIGLGFGQHVHVPAFRADSRCEVTTLCASTEHKSLEVARLLDVPHASGDWRDVVADPEIDALSIAVPPSLQPAIALEALRHGKAVFCEKPLAAHVHEALAVKRAAGQNLPNMVNFEICECDAWDAFRKALLPGPLGGADSIDVDWRVRTFANQHRLKNWKSRADDGGGALQAFVAHTFYLLELLKGPISRLRATLNKADNDPRDGETEVVLEIKFLQGGDAKVHVATDAPAPHRHQIDVFNATRRLRLLNVALDYISGFRLYESSVPGTELKPVWPNENASHPDQFNATTSAHDGRITATARLVRKFVDWALGGPPARPNFADGYRVQYLIDVARRSNAEGRWTDAIE